jgi:hypothetical protein
MIKTQKKNEQEEASIGQYLIFYKGKHVLSEKKLHEGN